MNGLDATEVDSVVLTADMCRRSVVGQHGRLLSRVISQCENRVQVELIIPACLRASYRPWDLGAAHLRRDPLCCVLVLLVGMFGRGSPMQAESASSDAETVEGAPARSYQKKERTVNIGRPRSMVRNDLQC